MRVLASSPLLGKGKGIHSNNKQIIIITIIVIIIIIIIIIIDLYKAKIKKIFLSALQCKIKFTVKI